MEGCGGLQDIFDTRGLDEGMSLDRDDFDVYRRHIFGYCKHAKSTAHSASMPRFLVHCLSF